MTDDVNPTIAVFDSGIGGLSVLDAIVHRLPGCRYIYGCDTKGFPYGVKTDDEVIALATQFNRGLIESYPEVNILVIACNTASTVALDALRSMCRIPVVGVVPALKPAAQMTRTATIGLLATPATIRRTYTQKLVQEFARGRRVLMHGSSLLVSLAEAKLRGGWDEAMQGQIGRELAPLFEQSPKENFKKLDTIVLGCTHFPHLAAELQAAAPWPVQWVDSGQAIAARVGVLLSEAGCDLALLRQPSSFPLRWYEPFSQGNRSRPVPAYLKSIFYDVIV